MTETQNPKGATARAVTPLAEQVRFELTKGFPP